MAQQDSDDGLINMRKVSRSRSEGAAKFAASGWGLGLLAACLCMFGVLMISVVFAGYSVSLSFSNGAAIKPPLAYPSVAEVTTKVNEMFRAMDIDGDFKLNAEEFKYLMAATSDSGALFGGHGELRIDDVVRLLEFTCPPQGACTESTQCRAAGYTDRETCIQFLAYGMVTAMSGDLDAVAVTTEQYVEHLTNKVFGQITKENEQLVSLDELQRFGEEVIQPALQSNPAYQQVVADPDAVFANFVGSASSRLTSTDEFRENILENQERRGLLDSRYSSYQQCCDANDCDTWDINWCPVYTMVCGAACIASIPTTAGAACLCLYAAGSWCSEVYHCMTRCDCTLSLSCEHCDRPTTYMKCPSGCESDFF